MIRKIFALVLMICFLTQFLPQITINASSPIVTPQAPILQQSTVRDEWIPIYEAFPNTNQSTHAQSNGEVLRALTHYIETYARSQGWANGIINGGQPGAPGRHLYDIVITPEIQRQSDQFHAVVLDALRRDPIASVLPISIEGLEALFNSQVVFPGVATDGAAGLRGGYLAFFYTHNPDGTVADSKEVVGVAIYESVMRIFGLNIQTAWWGAEVFLGLTESIRSAHAPHQHTGLYHSLSNHFGAARVFDALLRPDTEAVAEINKLLQELSPGIASIETIGQAANAAEYIQSTDNAWERAQEFTQATENLMTALNSNASRRQRQTAMNEFNRYADTYSRYALENNISYTTLNNGGLHQTENQRLNRNALNIHENVFLANSARPDLGAHPQEWLDWRLQTDIWEPIVNNDIIIYLEIIDLE